MPQMSSGVADPAGLTGEPQQGLQHGQREDLRVTDPRSDTDGRTHRHSLRRGLQQVVGPGIQCGREGVQVGVHEGLRVGVGSATLILGTLRTSPTATRRHRPLGISYLDHAVQAQQEAQTVGVAYGSPFEGDPAGLVRTTSAALTAAAASAAAAAQLVDRLSAAQAALADAVHVDPPAGRPLHVVRDGE